MNLNLQVKNRRDGLKNLEYATMVRVCILSRIEVVHPQYSGWHGCGEHSSRLIWRSVNASESDCSRSQAAKHNRSLLANTNVTTPYKRSLLANRNKHAQRQRFKAKTSQPGPKKGDGRWKGWRHVPFCSRTSSKYCRPLRLLRAWPLAVILNFLVFTEKSSSSTSNLCAYFRSRSEKVAIDC